MEGLPGQGRCPLQADDARRRRVHPPLSDPRPARRISPHPSLRPLRQWQPGQQHCIGSPPARRTGPSSPERRRRSRRRWSRTRRVQYLSLLRWAHGHRRDLRTRLPAATVAHSSNHLRQHMTSKLLPPPHISAPVSRRCLIGDACPPPIATVSPAVDRQNGDRSLQDHRSDPARGDQSQRHDDYSAVIPVRYPKIGAYIRLNLHRPTPLPAQTPPAVSSPEAFRTPASEHLVTPLTGRRPKTLNNKRHPSNVLLTAAVDPRRIEPR